MPRVTQDISHRGETSPAFLAPSSGLCQLLLSLAYKSLFPTSEGQLVTEWKVAVVQQPTAHCTPAYGGKWRTLSTQRRLPEDLGQLNRDRAAGIWPEQSPLLLQNHGKLKTPWEKTSPLLCQSRYYSSVGQLQAAEQESLLVHCCSRQRSR